MGMNNQNDPCSEARERLRRKLLEDSSKLTQEKTQLQSQLDQAHIESNYDPSREPYNSVYRRNIPKIKEINDKLFDISRELARVNDMPCKEVIEKEPGLSEFEPKGAGWFSPSEWRKWLNDLQSSARGAFEGIIQGPGNYIVKHSSDYDNACEKFYGTVLPWASSSNQQTQQAFLYVFYETSYPYDVNPHNPYQFYHWGYEFAKCDEKFIASLPPGVDSFNYRGPLTAENERCKDEVRKRQEASNQWNKKSIEARMIIDKIHKKYRDKLSKAFMATSSSDKSFAKAAQSGGELMLNNMAYDNKIRGIIRNEIENREKSSSSQSEKHKFRVIGSNMIAANRKEMLLTAKEYGINLPSPPSQEISFPDEESIPLPRSPTPHPQAEPVPLPQPPIVTPIPFEPTSFPSTQEPHNEYQQESKSNVPSQPRFCSNCGTELKEKQKFCPNCGKKIAFNRQIHPQPRSPIETIDSDQLQSNESMDAQLIIGTWEHEDGYLLITTPSRGKHQFESRLKRLGKNYFRKEHNWNIGDVAVEFSFIEKRGGRYYYEGIYRGRTSSDSSYPISISFNGSNSRILHTKIDLVELRVKEPKKQNERKKSLFGRILKRN